MTLFPAKRADETHILEEKEVIQFQKDLIDKWEPKHEVWSLKYGEVIIGCTAAICGVTINSMFRRKLRLRYHQGSIFTTTVLGVGTAAVACLGHKFFISEKLLLFETNCLICKELKAIALLQCNSLIYPLLAAPTINIAIAGIEGYRIPYMYEVKELVKLWWSIVRPESRTLLLLFFGNIIAAGVVSYLQFKSIEKMTEILMKVQRYMEDKEAMAIHEMAPTKTSEVF